MKTTTENLLLSIDQEDEASLLDLIPKVELNHLSLQKAVCGCVQHNLLSGLEALHSKYPHMISEASYLNGFRKLRDQDKIDVWEHLHEKGYISVQAQEFALRSWVRSMASYAAAPFLKHLFSNKCAKYLKDEQTRTSMLRQAIRHYPQDPTLFELVVDFYGAKCISMHFKMLSPPMLEELFQRSNHKERLILKRRCEKAYITPAYMEAYVQKTEMLPHVSSPQAPAKPRMM